MSDELTSELRELAAEGEMLPALSGAEIRGRALRRRRRRRTTLAVAGGFAAAGLALALVLNLGGGTDQRPAPAASPTGTPSLPAVPDATVDLSRRVISVAGRELPLSSGSEWTPTGTGRMTVTAKESVKVMPGSVAGIKGDYHLKVPWVIEFSASDGTANYIAGLTYDEKAPGDYDRTTGWIGLRQADAKWLYGQLSPGSVIDVEGTAPTDTPTARSTSTPPTALPGAGAGAGAGSGTSGG
ncbi:L,D-transpeptidase [Streptomyces sp. NBC_00996]|uniref:L,D-transpeptidase n=1 Tax=Streptomyces sp. NBC_00996 TaxID=2903710 RepID=UPI0038657581|nr:L,D-transpeptidase [Streptomyces sp. NBC_00996]